MQMVPRDPEQRLTPAERTRLAEQEAVIERTFVERGRALAVIRDERLYRETHATFEAYCRERWGIVASRARDRSEPPSLLTPRASR